MRLSMYAQGVIKSTAREIFGSRVSIAVFGSRIDDDARGGDIDLYIEVEPLSDSQELLEKELRLYAELQKSLGEQRIDLVVHEKGSPLRSIDKKARESGLVL